ncbi:hypothetical protein Ahy_B02g061299 [Arachis hypogaea]|uniref:Uncharacterized protein n=1 Tax=Arachis hypogaea TaxID=3818 RepID=A0A445AKI0_ARAHY|nr:hypothetical protein Ahy_B02g061299 [Arachis hypogaea]
MNNYIFLIKGKSFVAAADNHRELSFIKKDARRFGKTMPKNKDKYLLRMKEKNQNFFFELNLEANCSIKNAFWADVRSMTAYEYFGDVVSFHTTYNTNRCESPRSVDTFWIHSNGYSNVDFVTWEGRYQKGFLSINVHQCKGLLRPVCQKQFISSAFGKSGRRSQAN